MTEVLVIGGGPVGLVSAILLAQAGVDVTVWERRSDSPSGTRAIGIHPPSLDLFEHLCVLDEIRRDAVRIDQGEAWNAGRRLGAVVFRDRPVPHPYVAALEQWRTERILRARLEAVAPGSLRTGTSCTRLTPAEDGVLVSGSDADGTVSTRAAVVVVAAGGRATVDGMPAPGPLHRYRDRYLMGDVADRSGAGSIARVHLHHRGVVESFPLPHGMRRYVVHTGYSDDQDAARPEPTASDLAALVADRTGDDVDPATNTMLSAFGVLRRRRKRVVDGRVVYLGDAAHEISPIGGQGMNLGWSDARVFAPLIARMTTGHLSTQHDVAAAVSRQQRAIRRASWQAELNMRLGRPLPGPLVGIRDLALRTALNGPAMPILADAYTMRWLR
ncbi:FAD-dependent oxidoreductase [Plantibacter sp. 2H11-2]|uniref:FAD-dependent oxidoreductase n=1 Tax=Plantibacter sp. 2H11-2 TaxID=3414431 RepID=UPI003CF94FBB